MNSYLPDDLSLLPTESAAASHSVHAAPSKGDRRILKRPEDSERRQDYVPCKQDPALFESLGGVSRQFKSKDILYLIDKSVSEVAAVRITFL